MEFQYKTYRCEWHVCLGETDQYGNNLFFEPYSVEVFPSHKEALIRLDEVSFKEEFSGRRIPKNAPHGYCRAEIVYREIEVKSR